MLLTGVCKCVCEAKVVHGVQRQEMKQKLLPLIFTPQECIALVLPPNNGKTLLKLDIMEKLSVAAADS